MNPAAQRLAAILSLLIGLFLVIPRFGGLGSPNQVLVESTLAVGAVWLGWRGMWRGESVYKYVGLIGFCIGVIACSGLILGRRCGPC
jgi:hypothetical protein